MKRYLFLISMLAFVMMFAGCGNKGIQRQIDEADKLIAQAENEGADLSATIALQKAKDELELAKQLLRENKTDSALTASSLAVESAKEALKTTEENKSIPNGTGY